LSGGLDMRPGRRAREERGTRTTDDPSRMSPEAAKLAIALDPQTTTPGDRLNVGEGALRPYLRAVRTHVLLVTLVGLAALGGGIAYVSLRSPVYEATAQLLITPLPQDDTSFRGLSLLRDSGDPARTAQTAASLIDSQPAAALTAKRLDDGLTAEQVLDRTDVTPLGDSDVLAVTARADDPDAAARIANEFTRSALVVRRQALLTEVAAALAQVRTQLSAVPTRSPVAADLAGRLTQLRALRAGNDPTLSRSQRAIPPRSAAGPPAPLVVVLSLLAGLTIGAGAALLLELIDLRIRDEDDLIRLGSPQALTRVPTLSRQEARAAEAVPLAVPPAVREGFRSLQIQLDRNSPEHRSVMITSASTGDGKTSSSIQLAAEVAGAGYRTLLLDLDLRKANLGPRLGLNAGDGSVFLSLITAQSKLSEVLVSAPELPGVQLLLAPDFALTEELAPSISRWLPGILAEAKALADYVIIDTAPLGEVSDALRVATQVDDVLLVARLGHTRRDGFRTMLELLEHASCAPAGVIVIGSKVTIGSYGYYYRPAGVGPGAAGAGAGGWRVHGPPNPAGRTNARPAEGSTDGEPAPRAANEPRWD
jgi:Mrp family chromosome partitioning ATPase/capsular polysaccharide biosynthesis protein